MNDYLVSLIRTYVPIGVGAALTWLALRFGVVIDEQTSLMGIAVFDAVATAAYYAAVRAVERAHPAVGRVLLALGMTGQTPTYEHFPLRKMRG